MDEEETQSEDLGGTWLGWLAPQLLAIEIATNFFLTMFRQYGNNSVSVPVIAPTRPLKQQASVRDPVLLKSREDRGVQRVSCPRHGGELELLHASCDHTALGYVKSSWRS